MYQDPEISAMSQVFEALSGLDNAQIKRILDWITSKFGIVEAEITETPVERPSVEGEVETQVQPVKQETVEVDVSPIEQGSTAEEDTIQPPAEPKALSTKGLGLKRYKTIENLFLGANVTTVASRILLAAAYLQEKLNYKEVSSFDINSRLKKLGYGISNITTAINGLLSKKPPLMKQTKKEGSSKQAKRKFVVTEEGLEAAKTFLRSASE